MADGDQQDHIVESVVWYEVLGFGMLKNDGAGREEPSLSSKFRRQVSVNTRRRYALTIHKVTAPHGPMDEFGEFAR